MSTPFRIEAVELATSGGPVRYDFKGPLTVLSGPVGTGKSTLLELVKHALGGTALISPVATVHVGSVAVEVTAGRRRLRLVRNIGRPNGSVTVLDLRSGEAVGILPVDPVDGNSDSTVGALLMSALDLPIDAPATSGRASATSRSSRISFSDVWSFIYVEQPEIDRSIAHHNDSYREPKRKATFELLFGLTDEQLLRLKAAVQRAEQRVAETLKEEETVRRFLADSRTESRESALREQESARTTVQETQLALERLRADVDPADAHTDVLRDLLVDATSRAERMRRELVSWEQTLEERRALAASTRREQARLARMHDAAGRLAGIDFVVCPRCQQSVRERDPSGSLCRLCQQPEPSEADHSQLGAYEAAQLESQAAELAELIATSEQQVFALRTSVEAVDLHIADLTRAVDQRTRELVSPRLRAFADASQALGSAQERVRLLEETLRLWDRAADFSRAADEARTARDELKLERDLRAGALKEHQESLLATLSSSYQEMIVNLGVPSVRQGRIHPRTYLPVVDGIRFDRISTGGIRTALIVGYWVTLLATALREGNTYMPALLVLDSPRKSIGAEEELAANLYRQLDVLAENYRDRVQIIVADNGLPPQYSRRWQEIVFDYEARPVIHTVPHPGPAGVQTVHELADMARPVEAELDLES